MSSQAYKDLPYKDIPSVAETYADGVHMIQTDQSGVHITLSITRPDAPKPNIKKMTGYNGTAARIVMPLNGLIELHKQLDQMINGLIMQGILVREDSGVKPTVQ